MLLWYNVTILHGLGNASKRSTAPALKRKEHKTKGHKWNHKFVGIAKKDKLEVDKKKMALISPTCNLSREKKKKHKDNSLISMLYKQTDFSLIFQTIHQSQRVVSSGGVYVMWSITTWLPHKKFSGSCRDLYSTLQLIQPVHCWPERSHERCLTVLFFGEISSIDKPQFILFT